jgi:hypothetical protein
MTHQPSRGDDSGGELVRLARRIDRIRATVDREAASVAAVEAELDACAADLRRAATARPARSHPPAAPPESPPDAAPDARAQPRPGPAAPGDDDDLFDDVPV